MPKYRIVKEYEIIADSVEQAELEIERNKTVPKTSYKEIYQHNHLTQFFTRVAENNYQKGCIKTIHKDNFLKRVEEQMRQKNHGYDKKKESLMDLILDYCKHNPDNLIAGTNSTEIIIGDANSYFQYINGR